MANSMASRNQLSAYTHDALEQEVLGASPHHLITLLFDGALSAIQRAILAINQGKIQEKSEAISKAIGIVDQGLRAGLDHQGGGELVKNLNDLYHYITQLLLQANVHRDEAIPRLEEASRLLSELSGAWRAIAAADAVAFPVAATSEMVSRA